MRKFLATRMLLVGFVLFMIATLMFGMFVLLPGDPASNFVEEGLSQKAIERQRELWGLDDPLPVRYLRYLRNMATLEFGVSFRAQVPAREVLAEKFLNSIAMMLPALVIIMIGATVVTLMSGPAAAALIPLVVGLLAGFVAYGRRWLAPHRPTSRP